MNHRLFEDCCRLQIQPGDKLVLMYLVCRANAERVCFPSTPTIAMHTGMSRASVFRALASLRRMGAIEQVDRAGKAVTYRINLSGQRSHCETPEVSHRDPKGSHGETVEVSHRDREVSHRDGDPNYQELPTNNQNEQGGWGATLLSEVKARDPGATAEAVEFLERRMPALLAEHGIVNGTAERVLGAMAQRWVRTGVRPYDQLVNERAAIANARNPGALLAHRLTALGGDK